jgi:hypothetical protein
MQRVFTVNPAFDPPSSVASASSANRFNLNLAKCPDFNCQTSTARLQLPDFNCQTSTARLQLPDFTARLQLPDFNCQTSTARLQLPDFNCQTSTERYKMTALLTYQESGNRLQESET